MPDRPWQSRGQFSLPLWCYSTVDHSNAARGPHVIICSFGGQSRGSQVTRHCVLRALILVHRLPAPSNDATGEPDAPLRDANGNVIANNDNWKDSQQAAIAATGKAPPNDNV